MKRTFSLVTLSVVCCAFLSCSVPRLFWPQSDIDAYEKIYGAADKSLLVASRSSDFKDALVKRIEKAFEHESITIRFVGLQRLKYEDADAFDAVVIMNTCIAWGMDPQVDGYLNKYRGASNIIVLTTSGDGNWLPGKHNREFDAVASASEMARVDEVADRIVQKVRALLGT